MMHRVNQSIRQQMSASIFALLVAMLGLFLGLGGTATRLLAAGHAFPEPEQLTITVQNNQTVLDWVYTVQPGVLSYTLARSETLALADATVVNTAILSSTGDGQPIVLYYTLIDTTIQPDQAYAYWLTVTDQHGDTATYGPLTTGQVDDASEQRHQLFLPIIASGR